MEAGEWRMDGEQSVRNNNTLEFMEIVGILKFYQMNIRKNEEWL